VNQLYINLAQLQQHIPHMRFYVDSNSGAGWISDQLDNVYFRWGNYKQGVSITYELLALLKGTT